MARECELSKDICNFLADSWAVMGKNAQLNDGEEHFTAYTVTSRNGTHNAADCKKFQFKRIQMISKQKLVFICF